MERIRDKVVEIRRDPAGHSLRESLLKIKLLPYQLDGIAFVTGTGASGAAAGLVYSLSAREFAGKNEAAENC